MAEPSIRQHNKKSWRFTLRTLLIAWTGFLMWFGWCVHRARQQSMAVAAIQAAGGHVTFDWEDDEQCYKIPNARPPGADRLHAVVGRHQFETPTRLYWSSAADGDLKHLESLTGLWELHMPYSRVTDDGLQLVAKLKGVEELWLDGCGVTDAGLAHIATMHNIADLQIADTNISDEGLAYLARLPHLKGLCLRGTAITDAGLRRLKAQRPLDVLNLANTRVSDDAVRELWECWPNSVIVTETLASPGAIANLAEPLAKRRTGRECRLIRIREVTWAAFVVVTAVCLVCCLNKRKGIA